MAEVAQTFLANPYQQQNDVAQRMKLAEILQSQAFQPDQKFSYAGIEAPPSGAGALAKALQGTMGAYLQGSAMREGRDRRDQYASDMAKVLEGANAQPWVNPDTGKAQGTAGGMEGMAAALRNAGNPDLAPMAANLAIQNVARQQQLADKADDRAFQKELVTYKAGQPTEAIKTLRTALTAAGVPENSPGWIKAHQDLAAKETNFAPPPQVQVNSYTPASEAAQAEFMKGARTTYDTLKQAPVAIANIEEAKRLIPGAKGFMGPGGESLLEASKFLNNRMGFSINTEGVKSAEELRTRIFQNVMDNLKKLDAQPSQMQQKVLQESLGTLGTDPEALPRVLDSFADIIRGKVDLHNKEMEGAIERGVKFPYNPRIDLPKAGAGQTKAVTPEAQAAIDWLANNPNHPDAAAVRNKLRSMGVPNG